MPGIGNHFLEPEIYSGLLIQIQDSIFLAGKQQKPTILPPVYFWAGGKVVLTPFCFVKRLAIQAFWPPGEGPFKKLQNKMSPRRGSLNPKNFFLQSFRRYPADGLLLPKCPILPTTYYLLLYAHLSRLTSQIVLRSCGLVAGWDSWERSGQSSYFFLSPLDFLLIPVSTLYALRSPLTFSFLL